MFSARHMTAYARGQIGLYLNNYGGARSQVRPALDALLEEAGRVAASESEYASYEDVFSGEEKE